MTGVVKVREFHFSTEWERCVDMMFRLTFVEQQTADIGTNRHTTTSSRGAFCCQKWFKMVGLNDAESKR